MMEREPDCVLIREEELKVLLAGLGYESVVGLFSHRAEPQVIPVLRGLTEHRQIWSDGARFHVSAALEGLLRTMGSARRIVTIGLLGEEQSLCCYCARPMVVCQAQEWQPSVFRLERSSAQALAARLAEKTEELFDHGEEDATSEEQLWSEHKTRILDLKLYEDGQLVQQMQGVCSVLQPPELVLSWPDGTRTALPWTRENLMTQMEQLLGN